jgi:hypothetical protein
VNRLPLTVLLLAQAGRSSEIVVGGVSPTEPGQASDLIGPLVEAGITWWDERQRIDSDDLDRLGPVLARIEHGPPASP